MNCKHPQMKGTIAMAKKTIRDYSRDQYMDKVLRILEESGVSYAQISRKSGVAITTIKRWKPTNDPKKKFTRRAQRMTMEFALRAVGYHIPDPAPLQVDNVINLRSRRRA